MKVFASLLLVTFVASALGKAAAVSPKDDSFDNYLRLVLEKLREAMPIGIPDLGIPPLDPFQVPHFDIPHIEEGIIKLDAVVNDLVITNLASFDPRVVHADLTLLSLELVLFIPKLRADANYTLNGDILGLLPIFGNGPMFLEVYGLEISALAGLGFSPDGQYIQLGVLNLDANIESINIHLDNLLGGGDFGEALNSIISILGKTIWDLIKGPIFEDLTETLTALLNEFLSKCTLNEIISGQCELKVFGNL